MSIIVVILVIVIGFMINAMVQQSKSYHKGLNALEEHYEEPKYDEPFMIYLENHYGNKIEFQIFKKIGKDGPIEFRNDECFNNGLKLVYNN